MALTGHCNSSRANTIEPCRGYCSNHWLTQMILCCQRLCLLLEQSGPLVVCPVQQVEPTPHLCAASQFTLQHPLAVAAVQPLCSDMRKTVLHALAQQRVCEPDAGTHGKLAQALATRLRPAVLAEFDKAMAAVFVAGAEVRICFTHPFFLKYACQGHQTLAFTVLPASHGCHVCSA